MDAAQIAVRLRAFARERDWEQFHLPRNLLLALVGEVGELAELFQWKTDEEVHSRMSGREFRKAVEEEIADVAIYLIRLADILTIDLGAVIDDKIQLNAQKYPSSRARGSAEKYSRLAQDDG